MKKNSNKTCINLESELTYNTVLNNSFFTGNKKGRIIKYE